MELKTFDRGKMALFAVIVFTYCKQFFFLFFFFK